MKSLLQVTMHIGQAWSSIAMEELRYWGTTGQFLPQGCSWESKLKLINSTCEVTSSLCCLSLPLLEVPQRPSAPYCIPSTENNAQHIVGN